MKKRMIAAGLAALLALSLCACGRGDADDVVVTLGESSIYTPGEILAAMDEVCAFFEKEFDGCTLTALAYDETRTLRESGDGEEILVLLGTFDTGPSGGDGSLTPNNTYTKYQWFLTRSPKGGWELTDWGYG